MPSKPRPGVKGVYVELPEGLLALIQQRSSEERRPFKTTLIMLIEKGLGVLPAEYTGSAADDAGLGVEATPATPRPRGRPAKAPASAQDERADDKPADEPSAKKKPSRAPGRKRKSRDNP